MSPVIERCGELIRRMKNLRHLEQQQSLAEQLEPRRLEIEKCRTKLEGLMQPGLFLRAQGGLPANAWPSVTRALSSLSRVRERLSNNPTKMTAGRDYSTFINCTEEAIASLENSISNAWTQIRRNADPVNEGLMKRLSQVPSHTYQVSTVRTLRENLNRVGANAPQSLEAYAQFKQAAEQLTESWNKLLALGDLPNSVVCFFEAAQSLSGAPLQLWTDEVHSWMEQHDMLRGVRIHFRGDH